MNTTVNVPIRIEVFTSWGTEHISVNFAGYDFRLNDPTAIRNRWRENRHRDCFKNQYKRDILYEMKHLGILDIVKETVEKYRQEHPEEYKAQHNHEWCGKRYEVTNFCDFNPDIPDPEEHRW